MNRKILQLEGLVFLLTALYFYYIFNGNWILFAVLLFTPDISMVGYFVNKKIGALLYNLVHNYVLALLIIAGGFFIFENSLLISLGLILFAHVALDRFLGFGLKYPTDFKGTHLQKL